MINIFLLTTEVSDGTVDIFMEELSSILRQATVKALGDISPDQVSFVKNKVKASDKTPCMRILVIGHLPPERKRRIKLCVILLAKAWRQFAVKHHIEWVDQAEVWPIVVDDFWMRTTEKSICEAMERL
jgi:hypothetical protein